VAGTSKMTFEAVVISRCVQYITEVLYTLNLAEYWFPDYHDIIQSSQDGTRISLYEKYAIQEYQLVIDEYVYTWYDRDGNELLRADNSKHHDVITSQRWFTK
jgi:hypothetical protein